MVSAWIQRSPAVYKLTKIKYSQAPIKRNFNSLTIFFSFTVWFHKLDRAEKLNVLNSNQGLYQNGIEFLCANLTLSYS